MSIKTKDKKYDISEKVYCSHHMAVETYPQPQKNKNELVFYNRFKTAKSNSLM